MTQLSDDLMVHHEWLIELYRVDDIEYLRVRRWRQLHRTSPPPLMR